LGLYSRELRAQAGGILVILNNNLGRVYIVGVSCPSSRSFSYCKKYFRQCIYIRGLHAQTAGGLVTSNNTLCSVYIAGGFMAKQQED